MTYRLRNILLAVVLAVLAAFLTALYVANYQNQVDQGREKLKVFVAKADIPPGTPAGEAFGNFEQQEVLRNDAAATAVTNRALLEGQYTSQWIYAGEQVTTRRFALAGQGGIRAELKGNLRAFQLSGTQHQLLAGILKTGDHVDLVASIKLPAAQDAYVSRIVLRDIRVLKAPDNPGAEQKLASTSTNIAVILAVTDTQVQKLMFITAGNTSSSKHLWALQLRPPNDAVDSPEKLETITSVVRDGIRTGGTR
jgi:Flp pilus assembly protein CpaB